MDKQRKHTLDQMPIIQIEDDSDDHYLVQQALKASSIPNPVHFFSDGQHVLAYLRETQEKPLLILCDVKMPDMDGFQLRDQIEADEYLKEKAIPFIFFSTWANQELVDKAYRNTIQGYHQKQSSFDGLQRELALIVAYWKSCLHPNSF